MKRIQALVFLDGPWICFRSQLLPIQPLYLVQHILNLLNSMQFASQPVCSETMRSVETNYRSWYSTDDHPLSKGAWIEWDVSLQTYINFLTDKENYGGKYRRHLSGKAAYQLGNASFRMIPEVKQHWNWSMLQCVRDSIAFVFKFYTLFTHSFAA